MTSQKRRHHPRFPVRIPVRFATATDFVLEFAENLCKGGLFVKGVFEINQRERVTVQLELPGHGMHDIEAEVVHVLPADIAAMAGREPGIGLAFVDPPPDFTEALHAHLFLLGRRKDSVVLIVRSEHRAALEAAGYGVQQAPPPVNVTACIARVDRPVIGIVVPTDEAAAYKAAVDSIDDGTLVHVADQIDDALIAALDDLTVR